MTEERQYVYATVSRIPNSNQFYFTYQNDPQKVDETFAASQKGLGRLSTLLNRLAADGWEPVFSTSMGDFTGNNRETLVLRKQK